VDINDVSPHPGVKTLKGDAARLTAAVSGSRFDIVFSAWLTEYLDKSELADYFRETRRILKDNGTFMTTVIDDRGWGKIYTAAALRARGILKYSYSQKYSSGLLNEAGFSRVSALPIRSWFGVPWATFFICLK
jgi:cyclopropane fatty-acyl-phospholipid synthase-like methyltransferase